MTEERRIERAADKFLKWIPILAILAAGISGYLSMRYDVQELKKAHDRLQETSEQRRDKNIARFEAIEKEVVRLQTQMDYRQASPRSPGENREP